MKARLFKLLFPKYYEERKYLIKKAKEYIYCIKALHEKVQEYEQLSNKQTIERVRLEYD